MAAIKAATRRSQNPSPADHFRVREAQAHPGWPESKRRLLASAEQHALQEAFKSEKLAALDAETAHAVKDSIDEVLSRAASGAFQEG